MTEPPDSELPDEVPEADALEQRQPVSDDDDGERRLVGPPDDVPEADALDQQLVEDLDDDAYR